MSRACAASLTILVASLQAGAVLLGHIWGLEVHYPGRAPTVYTYCGLVALGLMVVGVLAAYGAGRSEAALLGGAMLAYAVAVAFAEWFVLWVHDIGPLVRAALALAPLLLALGSLVRAHAWASVGGVTLFVFTGSAMLTSNSQYGDAGSGFFVWFIS